MAIEGSDARRVLVIAGHDPTGGAGVDADREAIEHFGGEAIPIVTAHTDQARTGHERTEVRSLGARDPGAWLLEARDAVFSMPPDALGAVKSGLLPGADHVRALTRLAGELPPSLPVVVDPVLAASGGEAFLDDAGIAALLAELVPTGCLLTPNVPEAARLVAALGGAAGASAEEMAREPEARVDAARRLIDAGARAVVLKGGHGAEDPVRDLVLVGVETPLWLTHPRVAGGGIHGSGCRFASALAARLAAGDPLGAAAAKAGEWLGLRIAAASS